MSHVIDTPKHNRRLDVLRPRQRAVGMSYKEEDTCLRPRQGAVGYTAPGGECISRRVEVGCDRRQRDGFAKLINLWLRGRREAVRYRLHICHTSHVPYICDISHICHITAGGSPLSTGSACLTGLVAGRRRIHACHMRRRIHVCHMRRRIHACHMWRRIHTWQFLPNLVRSWFAYPEYPALISLTPAAPASRCSNPLATH